MRYRLPLAYSVLLLLGACQLTLLGFSAPATTLAGQVFTIAVSFTANSNPGWGGGVLQIPNGFTVVGVQPASGALTRDDPALLGLYTAEPGHYLASWSRGQQSLLSPATYRVALQAPPTPTTATFKVALAGQLVGGTWQANEPAGITNFAQITAATHVQTVAVVTLPSTDYASDAVGLPYFTAVNPIWGVALRDLDGDGNDDLVTTARAFLRQGPTWAESSTGLFNPLSSVRVAVGDFDGDGFLDLVQGNGQVFFGNGGSAWTAGPQLPVAVYMLGAGVGDFDGDGRDDIALGGYSTDHLRVFRGNANRTFTDSSTGLPASSNLSSYSVLLRDVTGDGYLDVVWHQVYAGNGQGTWTASTGLPSASAWGVDTGDLDGDGLPELVLANLSGGIAVHRHLGNNAWTLATTIAPPGRSISAVAVLDYDRDGRNDLAVGYYDTTSGLELWRNLGGMVFAPVPGSGLPASTSTSVTALAVGDVNGDSFPDLAVTFFGEGVLVFQNWRGGLSSFGEGCAAPAAFAPSIDGNSAPTLGNLAFAVHVAGGLPNTPGLVWFGTSRTAWGPLPLPFDLGLIGAPACTLWTGGESLQLGVCDPAGVFSTPLPIPNVAALQRQTFFAQGAVAAPGTNPLGFTFSPGLAIRVQ